VRYCLAHKAMVIFFCCACSPCNTCSYPCHIYWGNRIFPAILYFGRLLLLFCIQTNNNFDSCIPNPTIYFTSQFPWTCILNSKGPNLLWHLRNGLLEPLNPKVWFVMIGTNDLFTGRCTDKLVFANILNVLQELHQHRPDAQFIVHGILPRKDPKHNETQFLGEYWRMSQAVNAKLKRFCNNYPNLHYLQGGSAFMVDNDIARGRKQIEPQLMADGIHPTRKGLVEWGNFIVDKLNQTLEFAEKMNAAERKKKRHSFHLFGGGGARRYLEDEEHGQLYETRTAFVRAEPVDQA
jgi:lysophospholipase L1-like esterase